jgi:large subunit ribosomal protein L3
MLQMWDDWGRCWPITVIRVAGNVVTYVREKLSPKGRAGLQVGCGAIKEKNVTKPLRGHFLKAGVEPRRRLVEFQVTPDCVLPVGFEFDPRHFVAGQYVDVRSVSRGKGFQGVVKKHGMKGMPESHGTSGTRRHIGSVGSRIGRVFPGKRMAGRMGGETRVVQNLVVHRVDVARKLILVRGAIPGATGTFCTLFDSWKMRSSKKQPSLPFPTFVPGPADEGVKEVAAPKGAQNPFFYLV